MAIKKGDTVIVRTGSNKGKTGKVLSVSEGRVIVEGLNNVTVYKKARMKGEGVQKVEKQLSINISNVSVVDPKTNKPTRVGVKVGKDGTKTRITKKSGSTL